ncbi:MAG: serine acetyltransferase [Myxococcales bacterium]
MMYQASKKLVHDLRRDARRYAGFGGPLRNLGFWAGATHRLGVWVRAVPRPLRLLVHVPQRAMDTVWRVGFNLRISPDAQIGPGLCLIHPWSVIIGSCVIGEDCLIFHEVTLGTNANSEGMFPTVGDHVDIYVGARVLGKVRVGDHVKIGANTVIMKSVPSGSTVAPPESRTISAAAVQAFGSRARASASE